MLIFFFAIVVLLFILENPFDNTAQFKLERVYRRKLISSLLMSSASAVSTVSFGPGITNACRFSPEWGRGEIMA